jgi:hypothetical protein
MRPEKPCRLPRKAAAAVIVILKMRNQTLTSRMTAASSCCLRFSAMLSDVWRDIVARSGPVAAAHETAASKRSGTPLTSRYRRKDGRADSAPPATERADGGKA